MENTTYTTISFIRILGILGIIHFNVVEIAPMHAYGKIALKYAKVWEKKVAWNCLAVDFYWKKCILIVVETNLYKHIISSCGKETMQQ